MNKNYYEILGITNDEKKLTGSEFEKVLKKKYKKIAMETHPDRQNGKSEAEKKASEEKFKEASEAYDTLLNHRDDYDNPKSNFSYSGNPFSDMDFNDIFRHFGMDSNIFGFDFGGKHTRNNVKGSNIRITLGITLQDSYKGTVKKIKYKRLEPCENCNGSGMVANSIRKTCKTCGGSGTYFNIHGFMSMGQTCPVCGGQGQFIENPCPKCNGLGVSQKTTDQVEINIEKGVIEGMTLTISGMGNFPPRGNGVPGDLIINIVSSDNNANYKIVDNNLILPIDVNVIDAILGCEIGLDTVDEKHLTVKIPTGTCDGYKMRFRGYGIPIYGEGRNGDIIGIVRLKMPKKLSEDEIKILNELKGKENFSK